MGGGTAPKEYLEKIKKEEIESGKQRTFGSKKEFKNDKVGDILLLVAPILFFICGVMFFFGEVIKSWWMIYG